MSVLAIVALLLGIAAPVSLFAPLLFAIPIAGAAVSLLALRRIALSDGALIGRAAAVIGMGLSIASISAAYTRTELSQELLSRQARATALEWVRALQAGDAEKAFKMTTSGRQSQPPPVPGEPPSNPAISPLDAFRADTVVHFLHDRAAKASVRYEQDTAFDPATGFDTRIQQSFTVSEPATPGSPPTTSIEIILQRVRAFRDAAPEWLVSSYKSDDLTPHPE